MKKLTFLILATIVSFGLFAQASKNTCQVLIPETKNMTAAESSWLPGLIQSKLEANLQDYLGLQIVADSSSEAKIKKLQAQSESNSRDQADAIEIGKITSAKFALISQIIKSNKGYSLSTSYTDVTTGQKLASAVSKEYILVDSLYGDTGAVDDITLKLADKLGIKLSDLQKKKLSDTSKGFTLDEELAISKENDEQYQKMQKKYDEQLAKLMASNDFSYIENRKRIEADKALLQEKQNSEKRRQQELEEQKKRNEEDSKLESERSIALKTQRDKISKEAAEKAEEVRKLKIEKQGVLGQINVIEAKKEALADIKLEVEEYCKSNYTQFEKSDSEQNYKILTANWSNVEMNNGEATEAAKQRRVNRVKENNNLLLKKFYSDCDKVNQATMSQQTALLSEIKDDLKKLSSMRTVSSLGNELKISFGTYNSENYGWNAYYSLYSDGILIYQDSFILKYEALTGKPAPKIETATDAQLSEYIDNTDMYTSLLLRGVPILYYELEYYVNTSKEPGAYYFNFTKIKAVNTITGKVVQSAVLNRKLEKQIKLQNNINENIGIKKQREIIEAARSPELLRKYWNLNVKNVVTITGERLPEAINNISEETVFVVKGKIDAISISNSLNNNQQPIHLDLENAIFKIEDIYNERNSTKESTIKGNQIISVILPKSELNYKTKKHPGYSVDSKKLVAVFSFVNDCRRCKDEVIWTENNSNKIFKESVFKKDFFNNNYKNEYYDCMTIYFVENLNQIIDSSEKCVIPDNVYANEILPELKKYKIKELDLSKCMSLTKLSYALFKDCNSLKKITLPDTVTILGTETFSDCTSLEEIILPTQLEEIGNSAFANCSSLKTIALPQSLEKIGDEAFTNCTALKKIVLPRTLKEIGSCVFSDCTSLVEVNIPWDLLKIGYAAFKNCVSLISIDLKNTSIRELPDSIYEGCTSLENVILPENLIYIESSAFKNCYSLKSISIPATVREIGSSAFSNCKALTNVQIADAVWKEVKGSPYYKEYKAGLVLINSWAFSNCESIKAIRLPASLYYISKSAFEDCKSLKRIEMSVDTSKIIINEYSYPRIYNLYKSESNMKYPAGFDKKIKIYKSDMDSIPAYWPVEIFKK